MPDTLCRLAIHVTGPDGPASADLMLPAMCPVGVLIPSIVDVVLGGSSASVDPQRWRLTRAGGDRLDTSMSLRENDVRDGDLIILGTTAPPVRLRAPGDPCAIVAGAADEAPTLHRAVPNAVGLAVALVSAAALGWSGSTAGGSTHLWTAAALATATATGAVVIARTAGHLQVLLSVSAVVFATVGGYLAVPHPPWPATALLAASCGFTVSILLLRSACGDPTEMTAVAAFTGAVAAASAIGVAAASRLDVAGAGLTVLSLAALSAAAKLTVAAAGLGPSRATVGVRRSAVAHRILTGLVAGWSCAALVGVATVAAATTHTSVGALFAADVGLLLLLRQRSHVHPQRRILLGGNGIVALLVAFLVAVTAAPQHAHWLCAIAVACGVAGLHRAMDGVSSNPVVRRGVQVLEYVALAAVLPLAAWVMGVYGVVRDLSLP